MRFFHEYSLIRPTLFEATIQKSHFITIKLSCQLGIDNNFLSENTTLLLWLDELKKQ